MKILLLNTELGLKPMYGSDYDEKKKLKIGKEYWATIKKARNYRFHKKYWGLVTVTLNNLPDEKVKELENVNEFRLRTADDLHFYIKLKCGLVEKRFVGKDGNVGYVPKSIAFDKMDDTEFQDFYNKAVTVCVNLIGVDEQTIEQELLNFM